MAEAPTDTHHIVPEPTPPSEPAVPPPHGLGTSLEEAVRLAELLKNQIEAANAATVTAAPWAVRATLASAYRQALAAVSKLRGEGQLSVSTIARSQPFRVYREVIIEVLRRYPDALVAVRDRMREMENGR